MTNSDWFDEDELFKGTSKDRRGKRRKSRHQSKQHLDEWLDYSLGDNHKKKLKKSRKNN